MVGESQRIGLLRLRVALVPLVAAAFAFFVFLFFASSSSYAAAPAQFGGGADLQISKTVTAPTLSPGQKITFTLVVSNAGPLVATGVVVRDFLPTGLTYVTHTLPTGGACAHTAGQVLCGFAAIPAGSGKLITIVTTLNANTSRALVNTAVVSARQPDPDPENNYASVRVEGNMADLVITKRASPSEATTGGRLDYTIVITNRGAMQAPNVRVMDFLPSHVSVQSVVPSQGTCGPVSGNFACALGALNKGSVAQISVVTIVSATMPPGGLLANTVYVSSTLRDPNPEDNAYTLVTPVEANTSRADIVITKTGVLQFVAPPVYYITVTNNGPSAAQNVVMRDDLPPNLNASNAQTSQGACQNGGNIVTCTLGTIAANARANITLSVQIDPPYLRPIINVARARSTTPDPDPENNETFYVINAADLGIIKTARVVDLANSTGVRYVVTVTNQGPAPAFGIVVQDLLPAQVDVLLIQSGEFDCTTPATGRVKCTKTAIAVNSSATFTVNTTTTVSSSLVNGAQVSSDSFDPNDDNNLAIIRTAVNATDLALLKYAPLVAPLNKPLTYTLVVSNNGPMQATNVRVVDLLPLGLQEATAQSSLPGCNLGARIITCTLGTLNVGQRISFTISALPSGRGRIINRAIVFADQDDPERDNNGDFALTVVGAANLRTRLFSSADGSVRAPNASPFNDKLTYTWVVTNNGPSSAPNTSVLHVIGSGVQVISATASVGTCTIGAATVTCNVGTLNAGATATGVLYLQAIADGGQVVSTFVSSDAPDEDPEDNTMSNGVYAWIPLRVYTPVVMR